MRRLLPIVLLVLLASCNPSSFVAHRYDNFTAYYNTFYNAQKAFEEGVQALEASEAPIDRDHYLPVFVPPGRAASTQQTFGQAIEKSADVLRDHPNSKWVDDALMLIGKSYFYRQNYVGAAQKFQETIALGSGLEGEARFWLARALLAAGQEEEVAEHLRLSLDSEATYGRWTDLMHLVRGELYVRQGRWETAATTLQRGLSGDPDPEAGARAAFLLGQVRETMGVYNAAARGFEYVNEEYQPRYELSYAARLSAIRIRGLYGDTEAALQQLRRMEYDDKFYEKRAELTLLRAEIYHAQGQANAAYEMLHALLYDDDPPSGDVEGRAHYVLGRLHQHAYDDFSRAAAHFDTAATSAGQGGTSGDDALGFAPAAITDQQTRATLIGDLAERSEAVSRMDSLLYLGRLDDEAFQQFVTTQQQRRTEAEAQRRRSEARRQAEQRFAGEEPRVDRADGGTQQETTTDNQEGSNFLFHQDPVRAQEARRRFEQQWGRRPRVPNWRRLNAIAGQSGAPVARNDELLMPSDQIAMAVEGGTSDGAGVDVAEVPRDSASQAQMRARRAVARYELANALFLAANRPDSAAAWYERIIDEDAQHPVARRALYALAEVHRARGDTTAAHWLYRQIIEEHPTSSFARQAHRRLDDAVPLVEADSLARARSAYTRAYRAWQGGHDTEALDGFIEVAVQYPSTRQAPKALWAAATLFMQQHAEERLTPDTPLPSSFERVLVPSTDSTAVLRASRAVMLHLSGADAPTLRDLIAFIVEQYPSSPQAQRAERLLVAMDDMAPVPADSAAGPPVADTAVVDSAATDTAAARVAATDSTTAPDPAAADTTAFPDTDSSEVTASDTAAADGAASDGAAPGAIEGRGSWAIVVATRPSRDEAASVRQTFQARFQEEDFSVALVETEMENESWYRVAVGWFAVEQAAAAAMEQYADRLPEDAWVLRMP